MQTIMKSLRSSSTKETISYIREFSLSCVKNNNETISRLRFKNIKDTKSKGRPVGAGEYALLAIPAVSFGLGVWQTERLKWKKDLIAQLDSKKAEPAVNLPYDLYRIEDLEYQKVKVQGRFDHTKEQYIGPRSLIHDGVEGESPGLIGNSEGIGWHVITPFRIEGGDRHGDVILVNRGWVHDKLLNPETRKEAQVSGTVEIEGIVRKTEQRQQFAAKRNPRGDKWPWRDIPALASKLGTEEIFLDADINSSLPGGPIGGQTKVALRNDHFSYLVTWYTLSGLTLFMWCKRYLVK